MALDYSKLSDEELEAIANNDYSKLSDSTLNAIANESQTLETPSINVLPQAASVGMKTAQAVAPVVPAVVSAAAEGVKDWGKIANIIYQHGNLGNVGEFIKEPIKTSVNAVESYVAGHPWASKITSATPQQAVQAVGRGARALGGALVSGAVAPESVFALPYQMAAYEQEKIRQNPNAPGLERNPYAMTVRGEAPTQGAAGAMNQRRAVVSMPIQGVTEEERRILEEDQKRRLDLLTRYEAARRIMQPRLGQQQ